MYIHVCMHASVDVCIHVCMHAYTAYLCMYVHTYLCMKLNNYIVRSFGVIIVATYIGKRRNNKGQIIVIY